MSSHDSTTWTCPTCHRRVPPQVKACRCGSARATTARDPADTRTAPSPVVLVAIGLVLGAAIAFPALSRYHPAEASAPAPAVAAPPPATATVAPVPEPREAPAPVPEAHADPTSLEDLVARVVPAVASIQAGEARGSGFFVRPDVVVTNAHVVEGQTSVRLQVGDASYTARVATIAPGSDLALLQVDRANPSQPTLEIGSGTRVRVGQEVIAIGSALGVLSNTVTRGIVSGVRQVGAITLVQTDAAINPGNSGGPLLDRSGTVIGVNSMAVARQAGEGVAFAVAIDHASQLLDTGTAPPSTPAQTPLRGLEQMFGKPPDGEDERVRFEHEYAQTLDAVARSADQLDAYWARYAASCVAAAPTRGDRPWFAVFDNSVRIAVTSAYDCGEWLRVVSTNASSIRLKIDESTDRARRAGVFPGAVRELRHRYRLNWY